MPWIYEDTGAVWNAQRDGLGLRVRTGESVKVRGTGKGVGTFRVVEIREVDQPFRFASPELSDAFAHLDDVPEDEALPAGTYLLIRLEEPAPRRATAKRTTSRRRRAAR